MTRGINDHFLKQLFFVYAEWKPWEVPEGHKIEIEIDDAPVPSHVPRHPLLFTAEPYVPPQVEAEAEKPKA